MTSRNVWSGDDIMPDGVQYRVRRSYEGGGSGEWVLKLKNVQVDFPQFHCCTAIELDE